MQFGQLQRGILRRRYQRFLADMVFDDGRELVVHCPNTGAMTSCAEPGSRIWAQLATNPKRKYAYTWELVETAMGLACIHSARANALVVEALEARAINELAGYSSIAREVRSASGSSRIDLCLSGLDRDCLIEIKSVTLCGPDGRGLFPDAVSLRGTRHLGELMAARSAGLRAVLFFCVQHAGIRSVAPADSIDPVYAATLRAALAAGVEVVAYATRIDPLKGLWLDRALPVFASAAEDL